MTKPSSPSEFEAGFQPKHDGGGAPGMDTPITPDVVRVKVQQRHHPHIMLSQTS